MKTGAARIALGAGRENGSAAVGSFRRASSTRGSSRFRSAALVLFGEPISRRARCRSTQTANPPGPRRARADGLDRRRRSGALTSPGRDGARRSTSFGGRRRIFALRSGARWPTSSPSRRRFVEGHRRSRSRATPARLGGDLAPRSSASKPSRQRGGPLARRPGLIRALGAARRCAVSLGAERGRPAPAPARAAGAVIHYPAYRLVGFIARRIVAAAARTSSRRRKVVACDAPLPGDVARRRRESRCVSADGRPRRGARRSCPCRGWAALVAAEALRLQIRRARAGPSSTPFRRRCAACSHGELRSAGRCDPARDPGGRRRARRLTVPSRA